MSAVVFRIWKRTSIKRSFLLTIDYRIAIRIFDLNISRHTKLLILIKPSVIVHDCYAKLFVCRIIYYSRRCRQKQMSIYWFIIHLLIFKMIIASECGNIKPSIDSYIFHVVIFMPIKCKLSTINRKTY